MGVINQIKKQVDLPIWEWLRFMPAASSALSSATSTDNSNYNENHGRYIYKLIAATGFWRYDTWTDTYMQLSSPPIAPVTWSSMKMMASTGYESLVLAASARTFQAAGYFGNVLAGYDMRIVSGTGAGQERVITKVNDATVHESGIVNAVNNSNPYSISDSTKNWAVNVWAGYQVRITSGQGIGQVRKILYNDSTTLYYANTALYGVNPSCNPAPPSPAFSASVSTQSFYQIESSIFEVDTDWDVTPDFSSKFKVYSGGVLLASSAAAAPFYTLQYYDITTDTWYIRSATSNLALAVGTDGTIERYGEAASVWVRGVATGGTSTTLVDATKSWKTDEWVGRYVRIMSGTGRGKLYKITANTETTLTWVGSGTAPDVTSQYKIEGLDAGYASSSTVSTLTDSTKSWAVNRWKNYSCRIVAGTGIGQVVTVLSNTADTLTFYTKLGTVCDSTSVYIIQGEKEKVYIQLGGLASMFLHDLDTDIATYGRDYESGLSRIGSAEAANGTIVPIASTNLSGTILTVTTAIPHCFKTGWYVNHLGDTGVNAANTNGIGKYVIVTSPTSYQYTVAAGTNGAGVFLANSTTTLVDVSKSGKWAANQWVDYLCYVTVTQGPAATMVAMEIASNTATGVLTFKSAITLPVNGVSKYTICPRAALGSLDSGVATSGNTTTITDTTKSWAGNIHVGKRVRITGGAGIGQEALIASNTSNTLTISTTFATAAAAFSSYAIMEAPVKGTGIKLALAFGTTKDVDKGKYMWLARGGAATGVDRYNITTDHWEIVSVSPQLETLTTGSMYAYDGVDRLYFTKDATLRMYYLDLVSMTIHGAGMLPYIAGTAIIGNRMEIFKTEDGLLYLWVNRHSAQECFRTLLFW